MRSVWTQNFHGTGSISLRQILLVVHLAWQKGYGPSSVSKMKNGKAAEILDLRSEMVMATEEAVVDMITDLVNQITVQGSVSVEWEKGDASEREN